MIIVFSTVSFDDKSSVMLEGDIAIPEASTLLIKIKKEIRKKKIFLRLVFIFFLIIS
jgi:hypothetical protein